MKKLCSDINCKRSKNFANSLQNDRTLLNPPTSTVVGGIVVHQLQKNYAFLKSAEKKSTSINT